MELEQIYARHAEEYDALVRAEDCDGNLIPALDAIHRLDGAAVLEVGIGTARVGAAMIARVSRLVGVDRSPAMLAVAERKLAGSRDAAPWHLHCADARTLPVDDHWADVAVAGWVFGHFREWMAPDWQAQVDRALGEMRRALRAGGSLIVIETLGTGSEQPAPPTAGLAEYYAWLEHERGFQRTAIRTDYQFPDVETAASVTGLFFGDSFADRVRAERWTRVPECTGIWWLHER